MSFRIVDPGNFRKRFSVGAASRRDMFVKRQKVAARRRSHNNTNMAKHIAAAIIKDFNRAMNLIQSALLCRPHFVMLLMVLFGSLVIANAPLLADEGRTDAFQTVLEGFDEEESSADDQQLEEVMSGFDEETDTPSQTDGKAAAAGDRNIQLDGYLKVGATWNFSHDAPPAGETDWRGLSRLRSEAQGDLLVKWHRNWRTLVSGKVLYDAAYALRGRDEFTDEVIDAYESESEWREVYLQGRLGAHLDLKFGRQIVVWGRSDNLRITDVLNPLDFREPGLTDIEDLRLPVAISRSDGYLGPWRLTGIALHEIRFNKDPVFGHDFFPGSAPPPPEIEPSDGGDNTEWAAALNGIFSGKDVSFYWANLFNDNVHAASDNEGGMVRKHARVTMWGAAGNLTWGNWLFKSEAAYWRGLRFFNTGGRHHQRIDALVGTEYGGWDDSTFSMEAAVRHLIDFDERIKATPDNAHEDEIIYAVRLTRQFVNETVEITLLCLIYGPLGQDGGLQRLSVQYDWVDAVSITAGVALYQSGDRYELQNIGDNDRFFIEMKYSF